MEYTPLDSSKKEIRLLLLNPGKVADEISCALIYASLSTSPEFEALSYTWGSSENPETVRLDGHEFPVTQNLFRALRDLRDESAQRVLWIDAICVNQQDLVERSQQVLLMRSVYDGARNVVVWLGEPGDDSDVALDYVELLARESRRLNYEYRKARLPPDSDEALRALSKFFKRQWFTRVWVLQEVAVARSGIVLVGRRSLPWNHLCHASWFLHDQAISRPTALLNAVGSYRVTILSMFMTNRLLPTPYAEHNSKLLKLVSTFQYCDATNPRDKIYALLGLASDITPTGPSLKPDYTHSVAQVYSSFAKFLIERDHSLTILTYCAGSSNQDVDLPSWTPDWSAKSSPPAAALGGELPAIPEGIPNFGLFSPPSANPSSNSTAAPIATFSPDLRTLTVRGIIMGVISSVEPARKPRGEETFSDKIGDGIATGVISGAGLLVRLGMRVFGVRKKMRAAGIGVGVDGNPVPVFNAPFNVDTRYITGESEVTPPGGFTIGDWEIGTGWMKVRVGDVVVSFVGSKAFFVVRREGDGWQGGWWRLLGVAVCPGYMFTRRAGDLRSEELQYFHLR